MRQTLLAALVVAGLETKVAAALQARLDALHDHLAHHYRRACSLSDMCATRCIPFALSGTGAFGCSCDHDHEMSNEKDNERFYLVDDIRGALRTLRATVTLPIGVGREDFDAQLDEREEELAAFERHLALYQAHLLRKSLSGTITSAMLEVLKTSPDRIHIIADYKQKWLPLKHLETQQDAFGKRGKSIYGLTAFRWDAVAGEFCVLNVRVAADDSGQNWYHTLNVTATAVDIVLEAWPNTTDASFQSDGAGNFTSTATLISLPRTFASRGIKIRRAVISEVVAAPAWLLSRATRRR